MQHRGALLRFQSSSSAERLVVTASTPLSFMPKDWQLDLRTEMRAGLKALDPGSLHARFWDGTGRILDVENALMYNVGPSHFNKHVEHGLCLERVHEPFLESADFEAFANYEYALGLPKWVSAKSDLELVIRPSKPTLLPVWLAMREALRATSGQPDLSNQRLRLVINGPALSAASVKGFIDGVVSALHGCRDAKTLKALRELGVDESVVNDVREHPGPLGWRQLLLPAASGRFSWNPADDLLDQIALLSNRESVYVVRLSKAVSRD
jgi:hypothetical protein